MVCRRSVVSRRIWGGCALLNNYCRIITCNGSSVPTSMEFNRVIFVGLPHHIPESKLPFIWRRMGCLIGHVAGNNTTYTRQATGIIIGYMESANDECRLAWPLYPNIKQSNLPYAFTDGRGNCYVFPPTTAFNQLFITIQFDFIPG